MKDKKENKIRSIIDIADLSTSEIEELIYTAKEIEQNPKKYANVLKHKILATLFFEPSTRTRLSFESAMLSLGGSVIGFSDARTTSGVKGETLADTISVVSGYADIIAMRHPKEGAPDIAAKKSSVPIINAGDGGRYHPTQTLADLLTINKARGRIKNLTIGFCGDLKYGRTVHSLIEATSRYKGVKYVFISPEELSLPQQILERYVIGRKVQYKVATTLEDNLADLDVLYMTRVQEERFSDRAQYERLKDTYVLTAEKMKSLKKKAIVMHPLPRVNEIAVEVDDDPRAKYFEQTKNGRLMRMALILKLLSKKNGGKAKKKNKEKSYFSDELSCTNEHCISTTEKYLKPSFYDEEGKTYCAYCDHLAEKK